MLTIPKDSDVDQPCTYAGDDDLTGAAIEVGVLEQNADFNGDLDTLMTNEALFSYTVVGGGITITDGPAGTFTVHIKAAETGGLSTALYWFLVRIVTSGGKVLGPPAVQFKLIATATRR